MTTITYSKWIAIPLSIRQQIAEKFGIAKIRSISVVNNTVVDDGYDVHAVENSMNIEAMQTFTHSKEDNPNILLDLVVETIKNPVEVKEETKEEVKEEVKEEPKKKTIKKTKK